MTAVVFCIVNYFNNKEFLEISRKAARIREEEPEDGVITSLAERTVDLEVNGIEFFFFLKEVTYWTNFRTNLLDNLPLSKRTAFIIKLVPPKKEALDYKWNEIISRTVWEKVETDNLISWLSTLGGGFSALGESFVRHAEIAGKISLKQLNLGLKLGDPFLQARCKLYYSISLIQTGRLRLAKYIIREQYAFAIRQKENDQKLLNMCEGIWNKLQYAYSQRKILKHQM